MTFSNYQCSQYRLTFIIDIVFDDVFTFDVVNIVNYIKLCNKFLLESPSQDSHLWWAALNGNLDDIKKGIQDGVNVNARNKVRQYNYCNINVLKKKCVKQYYRHQSVYQESLRVFNDLERTINI